MNPARHRAMWASALVYVAATAVMGRDVLAFLGTRIASDAGDPLLTAAILTWNAVRMPWSDAWYQLPIFYPTADALTFSEHLLGVSVLATPIYWLTGNPLTAYNATMLLTFPLSGLAMYALVRRLTGNGLAAFLSGLAFAFAPYRVSHLAHIQILAVFWAPLSLLGLHAYLDAAGASARFTPPAAETPGSRPPPSTGRRRWPWLALFAASWMLQAVANGYFLVYFSLLIGLWVLWFVVAARRWRELGAIVASAALASLPLVPLLVRFITAHRHHGFSRSPEEVAFFSADMASVLCAPSRSTFWHWLSVACGAERELFPGAVLVFLCAGGAWMAWRQRATGHRLSSAPVGSVALLGRLLIGVAMVLIVSGGWVAAVGRWRFHVGSLSVSASEALPSLSIGIVLLILGLCCLRSVRVAIRGSSPWPFYLFAAVVTWILCWGPLPRLNGVPALATGPFAALMLVPGVNELRVPARFWMLTVLCLSILMGQLVALLLERRSAHTSKIIVFLAACGLLLDGWTTIRSAELPPGDPAPEQLRGGVTLTLPLGRTDFDAAAAFRAVVGGWSSANGYSGYDPAYYQRLRLASEQGDALVLAPFVSRADLNVVVDEGAEPLVNLVERQPGVQRIATANRRRQYRLPRQGGLRPAEPTGERLSVKSLSASCSPERLPLAVDGDRATRWHCGPQRQDRELTIDLGAVVATGAVVPGLGVFPTDYPRHLVVETSVDGEVWVPAWDGGVLPEVIEAELHDPKVIRFVIPYTQRPARYIRLRQLGRDDTWFWSIAELEVWSGDR